MNIFRRLRKENRDRREIVPIVRDGAIAVPGEAGGRVVPALRLDTSHRPDLADLIKIHKHVPDGDVIVQWGELTDFKGYVGLFLDFKKPYAISAIIPFEILKQGLLVGGILKNRAVYLEAGEAGDVSPMFMDNHSRLIVRMPDVGFDKIWPKLRTKALVSFYKSEGLSRPAAKRAAIEQMRKGEEILSRKMTG